MVLAGLSIGVLTGLLGHMQHGGFDPLLTVAVTAMAVFGMLLGVTWSALISPARLRTGFALFIIAVALFLVAKNYTVLL